MSKLIANMMEMGDRSNSDNRCRNSRGSTHVGLSRALKRHYQYESNPDPS